MSPFSANTIIITVFKKHKNQNIRQIFHIVKALLEKMNIILVFRNILFIHPILHQFSEHKTFANKERL